jgi:hypothetical protein
MKLINSKLTSTKLGILLIIFSSSCFGQSGQNTQIIKLNDSYNNIQVKGAPPPKKMQIKNSQGFILDCAGYDFMPIRQMNNGKNPDLIFIIAKNGKYKIALNIQGKTTIDASTMISLESNENNFHGFEKGDTPIIAIGTLKPGTSEMLAYWVGMLQLM